MTNHPQKPELLAPAGNFEKLEIAIHYGADAVYLAGKDFSLRNFSGNFTGKELEDAVRLAHQNGVKVYLACNIYSRTAEENAIRKFLEQAGQAGPDAVIISDPGILRIAKQVIPELDIHLSTQANTTNLSAARFWHDMGIKRVNLARELSLKEIEEISSGSDIETEVFIHGAMCVSYSGRCLLSSFLSQRDSNRGLCSHPCRWKYSVVEELRPGEYHPLMEDERGAYIFNSKDLCMIGHIPDLVRAGITSLKIEGRMKGINYLASVVKTYRNAIDAFMQDPSAYQTDPEWLDELFRVFHREYSTGFYYPGPEGNRMNYQNAHEGEIHSFVGKIVRTRKDGTCEISVRNKLCVGDTIEVLSPLGRPQQQIVKTLMDKNGLSIECAHPNTIVLFEPDTESQPNDIVRKV